MNARDKGVVIVFSPWTHCGSNSILDAQIAYYSGKGYKVAVLILPIFKNHRAANTDFWRSYMARLNTGCAAIADYGRTNRRLRRYTSLAYWKWWFSGRRSLLNIMAGYAAEARLPETISSFICNHEIAYVHANHCFQILAAEKVARIATSFGSKSEIVADSHDYHAENFISYERINLFSKQHDTLETLRADEAQLYKSAETILHLTDSDYRAIESLAPAQKHFVTYATLSPEIEKARARTVNATLAEKIDFLFVGGAHRGNTVSVEWLLTEVFQLFDYDGYNIKMTGDVGRQVLVSGANTNRVSKYKHLFTGIADDLTPYYSNARVVLAPAIKGTGSPIKFIEALAMGKAIVTNPLGIRGVPGGAKLPASVAVASTASGFLEGMMRLHGLGKTYHAESAAFYEEHFSNQAYFERLDRAITA